VANNQFKSLENASSSPHRRESNMSATKVLSHVGDALLSNWQSAVATVVSRPQGEQAAIQATTQTPTIDFTHPMIVAAAAMSQSAYNAAIGGQAAAPANPAEECAAAAFELAKAKISGDSAALAAAQARLTNFGNCDARWAECVTEFAFHYAFTKHSDVPYRRWSSLDDFVLPDPTDPNASPVLPAQCKIGIVGDWGTGGERAQQLMRKVAGYQPDILLHMGDIYYSCNAAETNGYYDRCTVAFPDKMPRIFTLCGNHDMYSGAAPYYALLTRLKQPASFFCLRNRCWQLQAMDTGYNDFDPEKVDTGATWVQDIDDRDDPYSELVWHEDKFRTAGERKIVLLSHHQPFTLNSAIALKSAVNQRLVDQFSDFFPQITLWLWGHEHNQVIYAPFLGVRKGRCIGASAIPVDGMELLYELDEHFVGPDGKPNQPVPAMLNNDPGLKLAVDPALNLYNLGYAILTLDNQNGTIDYYQYNSSTDTSTLACTEPL